MTSVESPYFRIERSPTKRAGAQWRAAAAIVRADIDEPVEHLSAMASSADAADVQLSEQIQDAFGRLQKPSGWGRDPTVSHLVQRWLRLRDEVYRMYLASRAAGDVDGPELQRQADAYEAREKRAIEERVAALTEGQLLELVTPSEEQLAKRGDAYVLDALTAKKDLSQFIARRSPEVLAGYRQLEDLLGSS